MAIPPPSPLRTALKRFRMMFAKTPEARYLVHVKHKLASGKDHSTLGENIRDEAYTREKAERWAERMVKHYGLKPDHLCVEYGCGSLWAAEPIIHLLKPGHYIGLDITSQFYEVGRKRLADLLREKQVRLGVISDSKIREIAALEPDFLYSRKVLPHVDEAALPRYMANVAGLMAKKTIAVLDNTPIMRDGARTGRRHSVEAMRKFLPAGFEIEQGEFGALLHRRA